MFPALKRHPIPVVARFRRVLVLTYAFPQDLLRPLLPPGLELDTFHDFGFVAVALVQTERLRPAFLPRWMGQDFFLSGYRIFARFTTSSGRTLRGLRILRSDTDKPLMAFFGNLLTHYNYQPFYLSNIDYRWNRGWLERLDRNAGVSAEREQTAAPEYEGACQ